MKRLIDTNKNLSFKNWVKQHNPETKWDFDNPYNLKKQLIDTVKVSGDLDIKTVFDIFFAGTESGLSSSKDDKFLKQDY